MSQNQLIQSNQQAANYPHVAIGYFRHDGDFRVLVTLDNIDMELDPRDFLSQIKLLARMYQFHIHDYKIRAFYLQCACDYYEGDDVRNAREISIQDITY